VFIAGHGEGGPVMPYMSSSAFDDGP